MSNLEFSCTCRKKKHPQFHWNTLTWPDHEDHIAEKGFNSLSHYNLVHKMCSYATSDENSGCKSSSGQRMGEGRKVAVWHLNLVKSKKEVFLEAQKKKRQSPRYQKYKGHTQVKMKDAPKLRKLPKSECPDIWIRLPRHKWPKSLSNLEDPVVLLERHLCGHPLAALLC